MKYSPWIPLWMAAMLAVGIMIGVKVGQRIPYILGGENSPSKVQNKFDEVLRFINAKYLEKVNQDELLTPSIEDMLTNLDPHSSYISGENLQLVNETMEGDFEGIGIEYIMVDDTINVVATVPGGPSEQVGLRSGDKIVEIEDSTVAGVKISTQKLIKKLRGKKGTQVHVEVKRGQQALDFTITRDEIPNRSVDAGFMLDDKTGYIKVNRFSAKTYKEFMQKLDTLISNNGMKDLVIDLRGNPGGYLQEAVNILNQLIREKGKLLLYTEGVNSKKTEYKTDGRAFYTIGKIAVLIDETSASASEILAGALQDWDRATIIGRRSFGKGLVQEQYALSDGSALRLTIAQYFIPSGRCIQKPYKGNKDYENDLELRYKNGELIDAEKNKGKDTSRYYTTAGRLVHGGGGITPDFFVPIETNSYDDYFNKLRGNINSFALQYANEHKSEFSKEEKAYMSSEISDKVFNAFVGFVAKKGVKMDSKKNLLFKNDIKNLLKARMGRVLFKDETQYKIFAAQDKMVKAALQNLQK